MDDLHQFEARHCPAHLRVSAAFKTINNLDRVSADQPLLFDDGVGILLRGEREGLHARRYGGGDLRG